MGINQWLEKKGFARVIEHNWWDTYTHSSHSESNVAFTFLPAHHWSAQGIFDRNKSLWGSWMITHSKSFAPTEAIGRVEGSERSYPSTRTSCSIGTNEKKSHDLVSSARKIYFAGDSAYGDHYKHIAAQFPSIHTALMPIAPGEPDPWMRKSHMDASQAVQAFIDLGAHHFIPMHWGTFQFGLDTFAGPLERLQNAWAVHQLHEKEKKLTIAKVGQRLHL